MLPWVNDLNSPAGPPFSCTQVREHYLVYEPLDTGFIAIVAVIRQGRDIPAILQKWADPIRRELVEIRGRIQGREIRLPRRRPSKPRQKK
jgi:hypothetical protein